MFCQNCGKQLDDEAVMCPACGTETVNAAKTKKPAKKTYHKGIWKLIVGGILLLSGFTGIFNRHIFGLVYVLIGLALVVWWIDKDWQPKK